LFEAGALREPHREARSLRKLEKRQRAGMAERRCGHQRERKAGSSRYEVDLAVAEEDHHPDEGDEHE